MTPPGKVGTISSRSPRCPRSQSTLRGSKTFSPPLGPCTSGKACSALASASQVCLWPVWPLGLHTSSRKLLLGTFATCPQA